MPGNYVSAVCFSSMFATTVLSTFKTAITSFLNQECTNLWPVGAWFLLSKKCMYVTPLPQAINSMMWTSYGRLNKFYNFYMTAFVDIISRCVQRIEACHRNQSNKSKLVLYHP